MSILDLLLRYWPSVYDVAELTLITLVRSLTFGILTRAFLVVLAHCALARTIASVALNTGSVRVTREMVDVAMDATRETLRSGVC